MALTHETAEQLRDQSLARTYQLPPTVRVAVGHYKDAREAFRKLEDAKKGRC